jgi:hypothetical protein
MPNRLAAVMDKPTVDNCPGRRMNAKKSPGHMSIHQAMCGVPNPLCKSAYKYVHVAQAEL